MVLTKQCNNIKKAKESEGLPKGSPSLSFCREKEFDKTIVGTAGICYTFVRKKNEKEVPYEFFVVFN